MRKLIVITPTYYRGGRQIDLIKRMASVLSSAENLLWILVGNSDDENNILLSSEFRNSVLYGIDYVYFTHGSMQFTDGRGNLQRNFALEYVKKSVINGVCYLADDDNYYDIKLFDEIRKTNILSIFPVGNLGPNGIERPIISTNGDIIGWDANWTERKYPVDMAGFAFSTSVLCRLQDPYLPLDMMGENELISKILLTPKKEISEWSGLKPEILCDNCRECYVWHNG